MEIEEIQEPSSQKSQESMEEGEDPLFDPPMDHAASEDNNLDKLYSGMNKTEDFFCVGFAFSVWS